MWHQNFFRVKARVPGLEFELVADDGGVAYRGLVSDVCGVADGGCVADVGEVPDLRRVADIREISHLRLIPHIGDIPDVRDVSDIRKIADVRDVSDIRKIADIRKVPHVGRISDERGVADGSGIPDSRGIPDRSRIPDIRRIADRRGVPHVRRIADVGRIAHESGIAVVVARIIPRIHGGRDKREHQEHADEEYFSHTVLLLECPDKVRFENVTRALPRQRVASDEGKLRPLCGRKVDGRVAHVNTAHGYHVVEVRALPPFRLSYQGDGVARRKFRHAIERLVHLIAYDRHSRVVTEDEDVPSLPEPRGVGITNGSLLQIFVQHGKVAAFYILHREVETDRGDDDAHGQHRLRVLSRYRLGAFGFAELGQIREGDRIGPAPGPVEVTRYEPDGIRRREREEEYDNGGGQKHRHRRLLALLA